MLAAGYDVRVATHTRFASMVTDNGLKFAPISGDPSEALRSREGQQFVGERRPGLIRNTRRILHMVASEAERCVTDCNKAAADVDLIVVSPLGLAAGQPVAEAHGIPVIRAYYGPSGTPTGDVPALRFPGLSSFGRRGNRLSYAVARQIMWLVLRRTVNSSCRRPLGLAPLSLLDPLTALDREGAPLLHGYSPAVIPPPLDWPSYAHATGYWILPTPEDWRAAPELESFLAAGDPPVYIGFGSMPGTNDAQLRTLVDSAIRLSGRRGIVYDPTLVAESGGHPVAVSDNILAVGEVPFDRLLPRVAAVVQHGGAGTIGAALTAGVPTQVVPFLPDQRRWAARVVGLGVGPTPLAPEELTAELLAASITRMTTDQRMITLARELGEKIRQEDGVGSAVQIIDDFVQERLGATAPGSAVNSRAGG
jgi:UDP:flavonoid glycosyltransferase YjiC (YdhE family)